MEKLFFTVQKRVFCALVFLLSLIVSTTSYALPFNITPKAGTTPPVLVLEGCTIADTAYYTITNETASQRNNNYIKYLPLNVTQVTTGGTYTPTCGATFNLAPKGQVGDSCTLQLGITGPVDGNDPNPHHHLFACFPGGLTCAGTSSPLNVDTLPSTQLQSIDVTPQTTTINAGRTQQYTAIGTYANGQTFDLSSCVNWQAQNTAVASITSTGLATGLATGTTNITATFNSVVNSPPATLTVQSVVYVGNFDNVYYCDASFAGAISTCNPATSPAIGNATSIAINSVGTVAHAYVVDDNNVVYSCPIVGSGNGAFSSCPVARLVGLGFVLSQAIAVNSAGTIAYITALNSVYYCTINQTTGLFNSCSDTTGTGFSAPAGIAIDSIHGIAYMANTGSDNVSYCTIAANGSFSSCNYVTPVSPATFPQPGAIAVNPTGTVAYVAISGAAETTVYMCSIAAGGNFSTCTAVNDFLDPEGVAVNIAGTYVYVANTTGSSVSTCVANMSSCTSIGANFPIGIGAT